MPRQAALHDELACCLELLGSLRRDTGAIIVVPSSLGPQPDVIRYAQVLGRTSYTVVLVAPVLAELDAEDGLAADPPCGSSPQGQRAEQGSGVVGL
jgi:hypothetical protein